MTPKEYEWHVNLVRERHQHLNLSFEQAEQLYRYEIDKDRYSGKHHLSVWEEWDHALDSYAQVLDAEQFRIFERFVLENIRGYEASLKEQDKEHEAGLADEQERLAYYEQEFLPPLTKLITYSFTNVPPIGNKLGYLRKEYAQFLADSKKQLLFQHYREYRRFKPNELKISLLRHQQRHILPDYFAFKQQMDAPTLAVAGYLKDRFRYFQGEYREQLVQQLAALKAFNEGLTKRRYPDGIPGWHISMPARTADEEEEYQLMVMVLLDRNKYNTDPVIEELP